MLEVEHQKVVDEIKLRLEQQDSWFHYKFILIGGVIAIFLGQLGFKKVRVSSDDIKADKPLPDVLSTDSTYLVLALACVIALIIDMHIRSNIFGIQELGLWIRSYVEPSYLTPRDQESGFRFWEEFLRIDNPPGQHLDNRYRLASSIHLHFMTSVIYLIYVIALQQLCIARQSWEWRKQIVLAGFLFVHVAILIFAFVAHTVPLALEMKITPFEIWSTGWQTPAYYLIPLFFLITINLPYLLLFRAKRVDLSEKEVSQSKA
jgi:hypothetical protein